MIEAFYSGRSGLRAHQDALDVVSNNIANINTNGFKAQNQDFGALLSISQAGEEDADNLAGAGTALDSARRDFAPGAVDVTNGGNDYCMQGDGYFAVRDNAGNVYYTRDGSFTVADTENGPRLVTQSGLLVLDVAGNPVAAGQNGERGVPGVYSFRNSQGLAAIGGNLFAASNVSGAAAATGETPTQGMLERSNVDLSDQMVRLITSQRGYQLSSSVVTTSNQIEQMVNELGQQ